MSTHPDPEQLSAYIDGELNNDERDDLEQHLTGCSECSSTLRGLRATLADMRAMPAPVTSEQESWALRSAINKARKRPAKRYRQWVTAVGAVAAVFGLIVVLANTKTASSTFSHTGAEVEAGGEAPRSAQDTSLIEIDPANYTRDSALQLLLTPTIPAPAVASPTAGASVSPNTQGGITSGTGGSSGAHFGPTVNAPIQTKQLESYLTAIHGCEQQSLPPATNRTPLRYIVGTFESTPAFFLIYSVPAGSETKLELWVVQRKDCYIRFFVPPR